YSLAKVALSRRTVVKNPSTRVTKYTIHTSIRTRAITRSTPDKTIFTTKRGITDGSTTVAPYPAKAVKGNNKIVQAEPPGNGSACFCCFVTNQVPPNDLPL